MIRTNDPANSTQTFKLSEKELKALKILAKAERLTLSAFIRASLADRINFELSIGNENLIAECEKYLASDEIVQENKPNAARIAPPAESAGKGLQSPTSPAPRENSSENDNPLETGA